MDWEWDDANLANDNVSSAPLMPILPAIADENIYAMAYIQMRLQLLAEVTYEYGARPPLSARACSKSLGCTFTGTYLYSELPPQQQAETIKSQLMDEQLQICEQYVLQSQKVFDYHRLQLMQAELIEMHGELYDMRGLIYRTKRRIRDWSI